MIKSFRNIWFPMVLLALSAGGIVYGQEKDFQSWFEAEVQKGLKNGMDLSGEFEQRFNNNSMQYDRTLLTLSASFDPLDFLSAGGGIRLLTAADREGNLQPGYRIHADAAGKHTWAGVDFSLRVRFQYGFEEFIYFADLNENAFVNRYRVKASHHIFGTRFEVFGSVEAWGVLNNLDGRFLKRMRYSAGGSYQLNFQSDLGLRYILEDEFNRVNPMQSHILVFSYFYNL
ncbi:MAG: DUF2490 domain-containing protein [Bacteroidales bacterium]